MGLKKAMRLKKPTATETSGVDRPAHRSPGWWVMKSEGDPDPEISEVLDALADEQVDTTESGTAATVADPEGGGIVGEATTDTTTSADTAAVAATETPDVTTLAKQVDDLTKALDVEKAEREKAETARKALAEAVVKSTGGDPTVLTAEAIEKAEFEKALATLPEPIRKAWEQDRADAAEAKTIAKAERDKRVEREYLEKAEGYKHLPTNREGLATTLRAVESGEPLTKEAAAEVTRLLKAADNAMGTSGIFTPFGGAGEAPAGAAGAYAEVKAKADEIRKADPHMTKESAVVKAMSDNPELARRYHEEMRNGV